MSESALVVHQEHRDVELYEMDVHALAAHLRETLPGAKGLSDDRVLAFAQYCQVTRANPWRGEVYPMQDSRGGFVIVEGYKLLVRWAKRLAPYSEHYELLTEGFPEDAIVIKCTILRQDALPMIHTLVEAGAPWKEAYEIASTSAIGVVSKDDRWSRKYNREIDPPKGWTWRQVAEKRALKNALNRSHGAPSPDELQRLSWEVDGVQTEPQDWAPAQGVTAPAEREAAALYSARLRQSGGFTGDANQAIDDLYGEYIDYDAEPTGDPFLNGTDIGHASDLAEAKRKLEGIEPESPDLDYTPEWIDTDQPGQWARLRLEAVQHLGYSHDNHVKNTLKQIVTDDDKGRLTYRIAWHLLQKHQQSKQAEAETD